MKKQMILLLLIGAIFTLQAQTRNLEVEGTGDQMGAIESTDSGDVGLELVRGAENADTDWRILNNNGNFRIQSETNNFLTNGTNRFSILENGNIGIGCTNPSTRLMICGGELSFSAGFMGAPGDKVALNGNTIDATNMVGLGYEISTYTNGTLVEEVDDLYYRAEGAHRWYTDAEADLGASANMILDRDGNLDVLGNIRSSQSTPTFELFDNASSENRLEGTLREFGDRVILESLYGDIEFNTGTNGTSTAKMTIDGATGNVGIGTATPAQKLHITGGSDVNGTSGGFIQLGSSNDLNLGIDNNELQARDNGTASNLTLQRSGGHLLLCGLENGSVGIGVSTANSMPSGYLLAVDGNIISEEVRVEISGGWPDYVFEDDYELRSIQALEQSIQENGHLPGIPSAKEIEEDGLHLGDMQKRMVEKIEELSLYIIQQNKEIEALKSEVDNLKLQMK